MNLLFKVGLTIIGVFAIFFGGIATMTNHFCGDWRHTLYVWMIRIVGFFVIIAMVVMLNKVWGG